MDLIFQNESIIIPLDQRQLLLKGTKLRNTKWIIGIIIIKSIIISNSNCANNFVYIKFNIEGILLQKKFRKI